MKRESRTVDRSHQVESATQRHLPLVDLLVDTHAELMELAVTSGLQVLTTMLEEDRTAICGPRYQHQTERQASRAGTVPSEVVLGGRKVATRRPRVRRDGAEVALPTFQSFADTDPLNRRVVEQMLVGVATRQYARSLEPVPPRVTSRGTSKSAVSRRFVANTRAQLEAWQSQPLDALDLVGLVLDGVHVGEHCVLVALGIAADGQKHALGLWEGSTENATLCPDAAHKSAEPWPANRPQPARDSRWFEGLEESRARHLRRGRPCQRCQVHKLRNGLDHLPERQRTWVKAILQRAYRRVDVATARRLLLDLARRLETDHPSAAESVREGLDETLTVPGLNLPETLRRSLTTTNAAESLISRTRHVKRNVKRWRGGQMVVRWVAAGVLEAVKGFRRLKGHKAMPQLVAALRARDQQLGLTVAVENVA